MNWLVADGLTFSYGNDLIFDTLSFSLSSEIVALQGPSGSGKTTLLKLINQDLQPESGVVKYEGRSAILILQDDSLIPWLTGSANIKISRTFEYKRIFDSRIVESMSAFINKAAYTMSFGQRRYIEIVRALGSESEILLLDEPLNFLDAERRGIVIKELVRQSVNRRILVSTHYIEEFDGAPVGRVQLRGTAPFREVTVL